jgi:hypothetical protein
MSIDMSRVFSRKTMVECQYVQQTTTSLQIKKQLPWKTVGDGDTYTFSSNANVSNSLNCIVTANASVRLSTANATSALSVSKYHLVCVRLQTGVEHLLQRKFHERQIRECDFAFGQSFANVKVYRRFRGRLATALIVAFDIVQKIARCTVAPLFSHATNCFVDLTNLLERRLALRQRRQTFKRQVSRLGRVSNG